MSYQIQAQSIHNWLKPVHVCFVPGTDITPLVSGFISDLLSTFRIQGNTIQDMPDNDTDILLTTLPFGEVISWRKALMFTGRSRYHLKRSPVAFTVIHATSEDFQKNLDNFRSILEKKTLDPNDYVFPGLAPDAYKVLYEQGNRGGPILVMERLLQAQAKCIHILLLIGNDRPEKVFHFDLVGAFPESSAQDSQNFFQDIVYRMITSVSTHEITDHLVREELISTSLWSGLTTPAAMHTAARELNERNFFTEMVQIDRLVNVPSIAGVISKQYSEGCFATWDNKLGALISTVTGSARPVDKGRITDDDLAVIERVREDGKGAVVRHVENKRNAPPSSEAVEMIGVDGALIQVDILDEQGNMVRVPVARSKLHGHRGISSFNPALVEFVPLDLPYYKYPVSCATAAQADGIIEAFSRSIALNHPEDPRQVVFTILPTHGVVIVEKWIPNTVPFQTIWEFFDNGNLSLSKAIPQGLVEYELIDGKMCLRQY